MSNQNQKFLEAIRREVSEKRRIENAGFLEHVKKVTALQREGKDLLAHSEIQRYEQATKARKEAIASPSQGTTVARGRNAVVAVFRETIWL